MVTTTTYGTWLPGDLRGYVDDGVILPGDPELLARSRELMRNDSVSLSITEQQIAAAALQRACEEYEYQLLALSMESWHTHILLQHHFDPVSDVAGRLKNRMRQAVGRGRIWTKGFDKRYCFSDQDVERRFNYINRHRGARPIRLSASSPAIAHGEAVG